MVPPTCLAPRMAKWCAFQHRDWARWRWIWILAKPARPPQSVLDASTRDANGLAGATLKLPTGEIYTADDSGKFVAEELYTALSDYIRHGCVLLLRLFAGEEFAGAALAAAAMCTDYGDARMLRLLAEGLGYIAIFDRDHEEV